MNKIKKFQEGTYAELLVGGHDYSRCYLRGF